MLVATGCFDSHGPDMALDGGTRAPDARPASVDGAATRDGGVGAGPAGACTCVEDSVCGDPPPFGCGRGLCVFETSCAIGIAYSGCAPGDRCDPSTLECIDGTVAGPVDVTLATDLRPSTDFDGVAVRVNGSVVARHGVSASEDYLEGVRVGSFATAAEELTVEMELYAGCELRYDRRATFGTPSAGGLTFVFTASGP